MSGQFLPEPEQQYLSELAVQKDLSESAMLAHAVRILQLYEEGHLILATSVLPAMKLEEIY